MRAPRVLVIAVLLATSLQFARSIDSSAATLVSPGDVLFCDTNPNNGLMRYSPSTGNVVSIASNGLFGRPLGVAIETPTTALVTCMDPGRVIRVDLDSGAQTLLASGNLIANNPDGITMGLNGLVYVAELSGNKIIEINPATGAQRLVVSGVLLLGPIFMAPLDVSTLVVSSSGNGRIIRIDIPTGQMTMITNGGSIVVPEGIVVLPDGKLLVADYNTYKLIRVDPSNGTQSVVASNIPLAFGLSLDGFGSAYVTRYASGSTVGLMRVDLTTGARVDISTPSVEAFGVQVYSPGQNPLPDPPATPLNFTASDDSPIRVLLSWDPVPNAGSYLLTRNGLSLATVQVPDTSFVDVPNPIGTYEYCVRASNGAGLSEAVCDSGTRRDFTHAPTLDIVADVPNDQGGSLAIAWRPGETDSREFHEITGYRIWRRLPTGAGAPRPAIDGGNVEASDVRMRVSGGAIEYWEPILTIPSGFREGYGVVIPSTQDSLESGNPYTAVFVSALTANALVFYDSAVDSGYSVDDLAPPPPPFFAGAYLSNGAVDLSWRTPNAPDVLAYDVYRGNAHDLDLEHDTYLATTPDTAYTDATGGFYYYKVVARDVHGNRSTASILSPMDIPTPAWVVDGTYDWQGGWPRIVLQLAAEFGARTATVFRSWTPNFEEAVVVQERLTPAAPGRFEYLDREFDGTHTAWYWLQAQGAGSQVATAGPIVVALVNDPLAHTTLFAPQPNPSNSAVTISFVVGTDLAGSGSVPVRVSIVDVAGRLVRTLRNEPSAAGRKETLWDGRDDHGRIAPSGSYRAVVSVGSRIETRGIVRLR